MRYIQSPYEYARKKFILGILFIVRISLNKIIESVRIDEQNSLGKQSAYFRKSKLPI